MNLRISAHHVELTPALRNYVEHRFLDTIPRHFDRSSCDLHVFLDETNGEARPVRECHAQLTVPGGRLVARERATDLFAAVDLARRTLERLLESYRGKKVVGTRYPKKYYAARVVEEREAASEVGPTPPSRDEWRPVAPVEPHELPGPARALLTALVTRRTVRAFTDEPVSPVARAALAEALWCAPSSGNLESRRFFFVLRPDLRRALAEAAGQRFVGEAPLVVVCCANLASASLGGGRGHEEFASMDVAASIENLLLEAHALGLGAAWVGEFDADKVSAALALPEALQPLALLAVGTPAGQPPEPAHLPREQVVRELE